MDGELVYADHWKRDKRDPHPVALLSWYRWLEAFIAVNSPDMASIEMHAYRATSDKTSPAATHAVAYFQGVAALCCKMHGLVVLEVRVSTARSIVLGNGSLSKDAAWDIMRQRYPAMFAAKTSGGADEMDAAVCALAGPVAAER